MAATPEDYAPVPAPARRGQVSTVHPLRCRAVVYVADRGFLIPALVSAEQMHRQVSGIADVVVAMLGLSKDEYDIVAAVMTDMNLRPIRMESVDLPEGTRWSEGHVPASSLGRLLLPDYLPQDYRHIVYIDGDTQIVGDVRPLVSLDVPDGFVAAAPDCAWMQRFAGRLPESYLAGLGLGSRADYFNAGVLAFRRETFDAAMPEALEFFLTRSEQCRYHDQSALNAVMRGHRLPLSPRYNFLSDYCDSGLGKVFAPVIWHFAGVIKPWRVTGSPIGDAFLAPYADMVRRYPVLAAYAAPVEQFVAPPERKRHPVMRGIARSPVGAIVRAIRKRSRLRADLGTLNTDFVLR